MTVCKHCGTDSATLARQSEIIEAQRQDLADLRKLMGRDMVPAGAGCGDDKLTRNEARMLSVLLTHESASRQMLYNARATRHTHREEPDSKVLDVMICRLRKKLEPLGLRIDCIYGYGYRIPREQHEAVKRGLGIAA